MKKFVEPFKNKKIGFSILVLVAMVVGVAFYYLGLTKSMPQSSIHFLNDVTLPSAGQRVLVFSPHPDDETIAVGGYIAMSEERGAQVKVVLVTDGNKHGLKDKRYAEFKKATSILGVAGDNLTFLNYPDGGLKNQNQNEVKEKFKEEINNFDPGIIIYPNPQDRHSDHATVGKDVQDLIHDDKDYVKYQYLVHYPSFPEPKLYRPNLYLLPPLNAVNFDNEWLRLMLSRNIEDKKTEAIFSYQSQIRVPFLRSLILSSIRKNELFTGDSNVN